MRPARVVNGAGAGVGGSVDGGGAAGGGAHCVVAVEDGDAAGGGETLAEAEDSGAVAGKKQGLRRSIETVQGLPLLLSTNVFVFRSRT